MPALRSHTTAIHWRPVTYSARGEFTDVPTIGRYSVHPVSIGPDSEWQAYLNGIRLSFRGKTNEGCKALVETFIRSPAPLLAASHPSSGDRAVPRTADRECDLGPVLNSIVPPMNPIRRVRHRHPRWIEDGTDLLIAIIATAVFVPVFILGLWAAFALAAKSSLQ